MSDNREILIIRHAEASSDISYDDIDRPLTNRGRDDASKLGRWIKAHVGPVDAVLSSAAARARETAELVCESAGIDADAVSYKDELYLAELVTLREALLATDVSRLVLVAHNPGLADLVTCLVMGSKVDYEDRIHMPPAGLARITVPADLGGVSGGSGELEVLVHPAALPDTD